MANRDQARPRLGLRRVVAIGLAAALGLAAVCLVVFGTTQKQLQVGVLLGLWGGLTAAFLVFGSRRGQAEQGERLAEAESRANQLHEAQVRITELQRAQQEAAAQQTRISQEVELRRSGEVELSREVAARREADYQLELSLRREIEQLMSDHIGALRTEVAALRAEVVDKLGAQFRLERIETTRVIGSDLEALQHEIRRLASNQHDDPRPGRPSPDGSRTRVDSAAAGAARWPVEQPADIVDAEVIEAGQPSQGEGRPTVHRFEDPRDAGRPAPLWSVPTVLSSDPAAVFGGDPAAVFGSESTLDQHRDPVPPFVPPPPAWSPTTFGPSSPATFGPTPFGDSNSEPPTSQPEQPIPAKADGQSVPAKAEQPVPAKAFEQSVPATAEQPVPAKDLPNADPFAGLPRLSPLPPDLDLIQDTDPAGPTGGATRVGRRRAPDDDHERYHGRRRAPDDFAGLPER
ncbi:MAG TPA: hypothetical protein VH298_05840 [Jatrophihabitans sp.]|nr:hypothetical protein [Jatrophihabitans sp.]